MTTGFHRRPLPPDLVDFSSSEGRALLAESIAEGTAGAFFPLVAQLHTQQDPAWCGLGTLVTVLNALDVDPGRTWKGQWRWFGEELLRCCGAVDEGLTMADVACIARCNGSLVEVRHAAADNERDLRTDIERSVRADAGPFLVAAYDRAALGQTGAGHYSPIGAWNQRRDLVLVLDVARFKYPPHWVPTSRLHQAMCTLDADSGLMRGWMVLQRSPEPTTPDEESERLAARLGLPSHTCSAHRTAPS
jgi:glutathione gamma-glutamylcysteinyltransferase